MQITVEVPDENIHGALAAPRSRYWALEASWDPKTLTGYVVEACADEGDKARHELAANDLRNALGLMSIQRPAEFLALLNASYDSLTGDALLQFMAFGGLRYR